MSENEVIAPNIDKPAIHVNFFMLNKAGTASHFKNECPFCEDGVLVMERDQETGELLQTDACLSCGQQVIYDDIDLVRKCGGW